MGEGWVRVKRKWKVFQGHVAAAVAISFVIARQPSGLVCHCEQALSLRGNLFCHRETSHESRGDL